MYVKTFGLVWNYFVPRCFLGLCRVSFNFVGWIMKYALILLAMAASVNAASISEQTRDIPASVFEQAREKMYESISIEQARREAFYSKGDYLCDVSLMDGNRVKSVSKERIQWDMKNNKLNSSVYNGEMDFIRLDTFRAPGVNLFLSISSIQVVTDQKVFDCN